MFLILTIWDDPDANRKRERIKEKEKLLVIFSVSTQNFEGKEEP